MPDVTLNTCYDALKHPKAFAHCKTTWSRETTPSLKQKVMRDKYTQAFTCHFMSWIFYPGRAPICYGAMRQTTCKITDTNQELNIKKWLSSYFRHDKGMIHATSWLNTTIENGFDVYRITQHHIEETPETHWDNFCILFTSSQTDCAAEPPTAHCMYLQKWLNSN